MSLLLSAFVSMVTIIALHPCNIAAMLCYVLLCTGLDVFGQWGPGGPHEGQLESAKAAALEALPAAVQDKGELRKASAKVRGEGVHAHTHPLSSFDKEVF
jgi:hypothetical protein